VLHMGKQTRTENSCRANIFFKNTEEGNPNRMQDTRVMGGGGRSRPSEGTAVRAPFPTRLDAIIYPSAGFETVRYHVHALHNFAYRAHRSTTEAVGLI